MNKLLSHSKETTIPWRDISNYLCRYCTVGEWEHLYPLNMSCTYWILSKVVGVEEKVSFSSQKLDTISEPSDREHAHCHKLCAEYVPWV